MLVVHTPCDPNPCNDGTCQPHGRNYSCHCLPGFIGESCKNEVTSKSELKKFLHDKLLVIIVDNINCSHTYIVLAPTIQQSTDDNNFVVAVGVVVGLGVLLLVVVIIVLVVVLVLKKKTTKMSFDSKDLEKLEMSDQLSEQLDKSD